MTTSHTSAPRSADETQGRAPLPVTTFAVLGQLAYGPSSGYEVKARLEAGAAYFWHASYSQVYAELRRLEGLGLVTEERVVQEGRPNKRVYTITEAGREALRGWLAEPWGLAHLRDESLVKLTLSGPLAREEVVAHMRRLKAAHERRRADFEARIAELPQDAALHLRLALRKGVHAQTAFAAWCQEVVDELSREAGPGRR
jgi:DNA-binding PadR family transcriptional regulator